MKPPKCRLCSHEHWSSEPHVFKDAINTQPAINKVAINAAPKVVERKGEEKPKVLEVVGGVEVRPVPAELSPNRRKRSDYNAYMREYMRRRRNASND